MSSSKGGLRRKRGGGKGKTPMHATRTRAPTALKPRPNQCDGAESLRRLERAKVEATLGRPPPKSVTQMLKQAEADEAPPSPAQLLAEKLASELQPSRLQPHFVVRKEEANARERRANATISPWKSGRRRKQERIVPVHSPDRVPMDQSFTKEVILAKYAKLKQEKGFDLEAQLKDVKFCDTYVRKLEPDKRLELLLKSDRYKVLAQIGRDMLEEEDADQFAVSFLPADLKLNGIVHAHGALDTEDAGTSLFGLLSCLRSDFHCDLSHSGLCAQSLGAWAELTQRWKVAHLLSLNLANNQLDGEESGTLLYSVLLSLDKLTELDLSDNPRLSVDRYEHNTGSWRFLAAFHERRDEDATKWKKGFLAEHATLTRLDVSGCGMRAEGTKELALQLRKNTVLQELAMSNNLLGEMSLPRGWTLSNFAKNKYRHEDGRKQDNLPEGSKHQGCAGWGEFLTDNRTLKSLDISRNDICLVGTDGLIALCDGLKKNTTLATLNICDNRLMELGVTIIGKTLKTNKHLTSLVVAQDEKPLPVQEWKTKESITLYRAQCKEYLDAVVVMAMIEENSKLDSITFGHEVTKRLMVKALMRTADFTDRQLTPASAIIMTAFLPKARKVQQLSFCSAGGRKFALDTGVTELDVSGKMFLPTAGLIAAFVPKMPALKKFKFGKAGTQPLAGGGRVDKAVTMHAGLPECGFRSKNLEPVGAVLLAAFLPRCHVLLNLVLRDNSLYAEGVDRVARALKDNETVSYLDLAQNMIEREGAGHIAACLETNKSLTSIDLSTNGIDDLGAERVVHSLKENKTLKHLDMRGNELTDVAKDDLRRVALVHKVEMLYHDGPR